MAFSFKKNWEAKGAHGDYDYNERGFTGPIPPRDFHASVGTVSVKLRLLTRHLFNATAGGQSFPPSLSVPLAEPRPVCTEHPPCDVYHAPT